VTPALLHRDLATEADDFLQKSRGPPRPDPCPVDSRRRSRRNRATLAA
jgi:hypothetical protein